MNFKIFCDESNHLLCDKSNLMVNGAICIEEDKVEEANRYIKYLKKKYEYNVELKWTKLFNRQESFYKELIDYFFEKDFFRFKATFIPNKSDRKHNAYGYSHDDFYYIVYSYTMKNFINENSKYKIYLDYKDSNGGERAKILKNRLTNNDNLEIFIIHSHESQLIQLCDLFIGAIGYKNRKDIEHTSYIKNKIIEHIDFKLSQLELDNILTSGTPPWIEKFNIFKWKL